MDSEDAFGEMLRAVRADGVELCEQIRSELTAVPDHEVLSV